MIGFWQVGSLLYDFVASGVYEMSWKFVYEMPKKRKEKTLE